MTVFVFSSAFAAKMLLRSIDYVFNFQIQRVILLREIYNANTSYVNKCVEIKIENNVDECIESADIIILVKNDKMPEIKIAYLKDLSAQKQKPIYEFNDPWDSTPLVDHDFDRIITELAKRPCVLSLFWENTASSYVTELMISKIFSKNEIRFKQIFSKETTRFLTQIDSLKLLNRIIEIQLDENYNNADVIGYTCFLSNNINELQSQLSYLRTTFPDFIILHFDYNTNNIGTLKNYIQQGFPESMVTTIVSRYISVDNEYHVYYSKNLLVSENELDICDIEIESKLERLLFTHLAYPDEIRVL